MNYYDFLGYLLMFSLAGIGLALLLLWIPF